MRKKDEFDYFSRDRLEQFLQDKSRTQSAAAVAGSFSPWLTMIGSRLYLPLRNSEHNPEVGGKFAHANTVGLDGGSSEKGTHPFHCTRHFCVRSGGIDAHAQF
jgi:hypothetical protein